MSRSSPAELPLPPARAAADDLPADAVEVGRILGAWGVKGGIKVKPFSADPQALFATKRWFVQPPLSTAAPAPKRPPVAGPWPALLRVVQAREQGDHIVATVQDLEDREQAEALGGARIFVSRTSFPTPGDDEFYWVDLIGIAVSNREGLELGTVVGLVETGPSCVLRVQAGVWVEGVVNECLIPFVSAYVDKVDLAARHMQVDWQSDY